MWVPMFVQSLAKAQRIAIGDPFGINTLVRKADMFVEAAHISSCIVVRKCSSAEYCRDRQWPSNHWKGLIHGHRHKPRPNKLIVDTSTSQHLTRISSLSSDCSGNMDNLAPCFCPLCWTIDFKLSPAMAWRHDLQTTWCFLWAFEHRQHCPGSGYPHCHLYI